MVQSALSPTPIPTDAASVDAEWVADAAARVLAVLEGERATWQPWHVQPAGDSGWRLQRTGGDVSMGLLRPRDYPAGSSQAAPTQAWKAASWASVGRSTRER